MEQNDPLPFWFARAGARGATPEEIDLAEDQIGYRLPGGFRELLMQQNGGVSNYACRFEGADLYFPALFSVEMIVQAHEVADDFGTPRGIIAIGSGGHDWLGLDYRSGRRPAVVFQEDDDSPIIQIAESFEVFVTMLVEGE